MSDRELVREFICCETTRNTLKGGGGGVNSVYIKGTNFCNIKGDIDNNMCVCGKSSTKNETDI